MKTGLNIDVIFFGIFNALISSAMSSYVQTSLTSLEDPAVLMFSQTDVDKVKFTPEETKVDQEIDEIHTKTCYIFVANCWINLKHKKIQYSEEHRFNVCFAKIQEFQVCKSITESAAKTSITATEERLKIAKKEKHEKSKEKAYRERRLFYLKENWKRMRTNAAEFITGTSSTTVKPEFEPNKAGDES